MTSVPKEPFFVDFLQEAPEPTGEEPEGADLDAPKIYEQVKEQTHINEFGKVRKVLE